MELATNSLGFSIFIFSQQIVAFPLIARKETANFGDILTIFAIINIVSSFLGNALGQLKLVQKQKYAELNINGDYRIILSYFIVFSFLFGIFITKLFFDVSSISKLFMIGLLYGFCTLRTYTTYDFRFQNKIKEILYYNIVYTVVLIVLSIVYYYSNIGFSWIYIFLIAELCSFLYYSPKLIIFKESKSKSFLFKETLKKTFLFAFNGGMSYIINSSDRLLLKPLVGSNGVAIYYSASFVSKIGSLVLNPLNGVILRKLSDEKSDAKKLIVKATSISSIIILMVYFIILLIISPPIMKLLYPFYYTEAIKIYALISFSSACIASIGIIKQILIRFYPPSTLSMIMTIYTIGFISLAILMTLKGGIAGFAISTIISNVSLYISILYLITKSQVNN